MKNLAIYIGMSGLLILSFFSCSNQKINEKASTDTTLVKKIYPEWIKSANIYEVNIRQYTPEGSFEAFSNHLPRLKEMGVDIIWLMPVHPIGIKNRKGKLGSYYSVRDYKDVNTEFGNKEDFKKLVDKTHELGMYIIIDWVANHTAWDNELLTSHPEWYKTDSTGKLLSPYDWSDVVSLDYSKSGLRNYMTETMRFWVENYNIDGFRCDVAGLVPVSFWDSTRSVLQQIKPVFMLAEAEELPLVQDAFDAYYAWTLMHRMNELAKGKQNTDSIFNHLIQTSEGYPTEAFQMNFTSNHDENSWNGTEYERYGSAAKAYAVLCYTIPGMPLVYSGQESALKKRLAFFEKDPIVWGKYILQDFYQTLNFLKRDNEALWNPPYGGSLERINTGDNPMMLGFVREKNRNRVITLINFGKNPGSFSVDESFPAHIYKNVFTNSKTEIKSGNNIQLNAGEFIIYTTH